jgi:hypothetical protein
VPVNPVTSRHNFVRTRPRTSVSNTYQTEKIVLRLISALGVAAVLAGCAVAPYSDYGYYDYYGYGYDYPYPYAYDYYPGYASIGFFGGGGRFFHHGGHHGFRGHGGMHGGGERVSGGGPWEGGSMGHAGGFGGGGRAR